MKKFIIRILILNFLYSCSTENNYDTDKYKQFETNPEYNLKVKNKVKLKPIDTLNITTKNKPIHYFSNDIYKDSLFFGIVSTFGGKDRNKIDVYDLKNERFLKTIQVTDYKITQPMLNVSVHSLDTIIVTQAYPPEIKLINYTGNIVRNIKLGNIELNIDNPKAPKIDNYYLVRLNNKPRIIDNKLYFLIEPMGVANMPGFKNAQRLAIYDLKNDTLLKAICPAKGPVALNGVFYLNQLMHPYFTINNNKIFMSYPIDHNVYIYDLDGNFLEQKLVSASKFEKLPKPLKYSKIKNREYVRNWWIPIPFYGNLNYHSKAHLYTRIFHQSQPLKMTNGKLNDGSKRKGYILIYDEQFNKLGEVPFDNGQLGVYKALPLSDGYLIAPNKNHWHNENEFVEKYKYQFRNN